MRHHARGLCSNGNHGTSTQEVLLEHRLSFGWTPGFRVKVHEGLELGKRGARVRNVGFSMIDMKIETEFSSLVLWY